MLQIYNPIKGLHYVIYFIYEDHINVICFLL